jgi:hypothetical protein
MTTDDNSVTSAGFVSLSRVACVVAGSRNNDMIRRSLWRRFYAVR